MSIDFSELTKISVKEIEEKTIIRYPEILDLCYYPYPNHPNGCPNISKCHFHINVPYFDVINDYGEYLHYYLIYLEFNFEKYKELRKKEKPYFFNTKARLRCVLYWQGALKKIIRTFIEEVWKQNKNFYVLGCGSGLKLSFQKQVASMEGVGINVLSTMKLNKIKFEVKPKSRIVLCNLLCSKQKISFDNKIKEKTLLNYFKE